MTLTLLPDTQVTYLRSVKKTAVILLAMGMIDALYPGRAVKVEEMADIVDVDPRTCAKHLQSLASSNRLIFNGIGYVLADGGRANFLPATTESTEALQALTDGQALQALDNQALQALDVVTVTANNAAQNAPHTMCALKEVVEESESLKVKDSPTSNSLKNAQSVQSVDELKTLRILNETPHLDGFRPLGVFTRGLKVLSISPRVALGWLAQILHTRDAAMRIPAAIVYRHLDNGDKPQQEYLDNPTQYLPREFLERIGLELSPETVEVEHVEQPVDETVASNPAHVQALINGRMSAASAWQNTLEQIKAEISEASFDTWLSGTRAIDYADCTLTVGARDAFACDWLTRRMTSKVQELLSSILSLTVSVEFVVCGD